MGTLECSQLVRARGRARHHAPPPTSPGDSQTPERSPGDHPQVSPGPPDVLRVPLQSPGEICGGVPRRSGGSPGEIWGEPQGDLWGELQGNLGAAPRRYGGALRISGGPSDPQASSTSWSNNTDLCQWLQVQHPRKDYETLTRWLAMTKETEFADSTKRGL